MINPSDLLVRLPTDPSYPYEYYAKIDSEKDMIDWVSDPTTNHLMHIDKLFNRKYENLIVDDYDTLFQFKGLKAPNKSIQMVVAQDDHGEKKIGVESSWIYPEMVRVYLPEVEDARITIFKCVPESQVIKVERRLVHIQRLLKKLVVPVGLASVTQYDPISGKCQIWIQNNFEYSRMLKHHAPEPIVLGSQVFNLHAMGDIHAIAKWAKKTCGYVLNRDAQLAI